MTYQVQYPTIEELKAMGAQAIFSRAATHLIKQGTKSLEDSGNGCMYRGTGGTCCAVGALIPQEVYQEEMEGNAIERLIHWSGFSEDLIEVFTEYRGLLSDLQHVHDAYPPAVWDVELERVASKYGLKLPEGLIPEPTTV